MGDCDLLNGRFLCEQAIENEEKTRPQAIIVALWLPSRRCLILYVVRHKCYCGVGDSWVDAISR